MRVGVIHYNSHAIFDRLEFFIPRCTLQAVHRSYLYQAGLRTFGVRPRDMQKTIAYLQEVSKRLNKVVIENVDFGRLIKTYDRESALFYCDPPYYEAEKYYHDRFQPEDHVRLRDALSWIKGKFILSYNDCPEIRELYAGYHLLEVERQDNLTAKTNPRRYKELIIKNY